MKNGTRQPHSLISSGGEEQVHDDAHENTQARANGAGHVDHGGPEAAALRGSHLRQVGLSGGHFATVGRTLNQACGQQHDGGEHARGLEGGCHADHQRAQCDTSDRGQQYSLTTHAVGHPTEEQTADRAENEAHGKDGHGAQDGGHGIRRVEDLASKVNGECRVITPVVSLQGVANARVDEGFPGRDGNAARIGLRVRGGS